MASSTIEKAIIAHGAAVGKLGGRLVLVNKPRANLYKFFTIPAEQNGGVMVEKYTTRYGVTFEKHIGQNRVVTWWRLLTTIPQPAKG